MKNAYRFLHERFIELSGVPEKKIIHDELYSLGTCYRFSLQYTLGMNKGEIVWGKRLEDGVKTFQKYIMQNVVLHNDCTAPLIYVYYHIYKNPKGKYKGLPIVGGYVLTDSFIPERKMYGINQGLKRLGGCVLKLDVVSQTESVIRMEAEDECKDSEGEDNVNENEIQKYTKMLMKYRMNTDVEELFKITCEDVKRNNDEMNNYTSHLVFCESYKYHSSEGELECQKILTRHPGVRKVRLQYTLEACSYKKPLPFDFYCETIDGTSFLIEYQGQQHYKRVPYWDGENGYEERKERDRIKKEYAEKTGIPLLIIPYTKRKKLGDVIDAFVREISSKTDLEDEENETANDNIVTILDYLNCSFEH